LYSNNIEIAILINSSREFDYYDDESFKTNNINIIKIINDDSRQVNYKNLYPNLKDYKIKKYKFLSNIISNKLKYDYVISTGLGHLQIFKISNLLLYFYA
jgi:hypothetical protein